MFFQLAASGLLKFVGEVAEHMEWEEETHRHVGKYMSRRQIERDLAAGIPTYTGEVYAVQVSGGPREGLYFTSSMEDARDILAVVTGYLAKKRAVERKELPPSVLPAEEAYVRSFISDDAKVCIPWTMLPHAPEWHRREAARQGRLLIG